MHPSTLVSNSQAEHNLTVKFTLTRQLSAVVRKRAQVRLPVGPPTAACQPLNSNIQSPPRNEMPLGRGICCQACSLSSHNSTRGANHGSITHRTPLLQASLSFMRTPTTQHLGSLHCHQAPERASSTSEREDKAPKKPSVP